MERIAEKDENISQSVGIGATATLFTFQVPTKAKMLVTHFGNYIDIVAAWGLVTWRILKNGVGVSPYGAILDQLGRSEEPRPIAPIKFNGGDVLTIPVTNGHGAAVQCGVAIKLEVMN